MARHGEGDQHFEAPKTGEHGSSEALLRATDSHRGVSEKMFGDQAAMINSHHAALRDGNFAQNDEYNVLKASLQAKVFKTALE